MQVGIELTHRHLQCQQPQARFSALIDTGFQLDGSIPKHIYEKFEDLPIYDDLPVVDHVLIGATGDPVNPVDKKGKQKPLRYYPTCAIWIYPYGTGSQVTSALRVPTAGGVFVPDSEKAYPILGLRILETLKARILSDHTRREFSLEIPKERYDELLLTSQRSVQGKV